MHIYLKYNGKLITIESPKNIKDNLENSLIAFALSTKRDFVSSKETPPIVLKSEHITNKTGNT